MRSGWRAIIYGTRRAEVIRWSGLVSNYCCALVVLVSPARRAEWFVKWVETVATSTTIHMGTFEEGLGRIMFVAGALEHERPFLAPLYKFLTMHPRNSIRRVPPYVSFILRYLAQECFVEETLRLRIEDISSWLHASR